jgi:pimeloyl-ACP methyl ester carboxylesterase
MTMKMGILVAGIAVVLLAVLGAVLAIWRYPLEINAWQERRALTSRGLRKTFLTSPAGRIALFEGGSGPAVVLLHGAGDQAGTWSKIVPGLVSKYSVFVPDLPGHGESEPHSGALNLDLLLQGVDAVVKHAGGANVGLVGNSLGGMLAMLYAHRHPERLSRIVVIDGGVLRGDRPDLTLMPRNRAEARKLLDAEMDPGSPRVPGFVLDDIVRQANAGPLARMADGRDVSRHLLEGRLGEVRVPVDFLWGASDQLLSLDYARRMQAGLPASRLTALERCGHVPQRECPGQLTKALLSVLAQQPPAPKAQEH